MSGIVELISQKYIYVVAAGLLSVVVFMGTFAVKTVLEKAKETKSQISAISTELTLQRTNCLTTLQAQGDKQIQILERIAESVSYLKGKTDQ